MKEEMSVEEIKKLFSKTPEELMNEEVDIICFDRCIDETPLYFGDHENELIKALDTVTLDVPILLTRKNPDNWHDEAVELTPRILDFLKELRDDDCDLDYGLYFNYHFRKGTLGSIDCDHEDSFYSEFITEDEFIQSEREAWTEAEKHEGEENPLLGVIADFHNKKWHDGEEFWKVNEDGQIVHETK